MVLGSAAGSTSPSSPKLGVGWSVLPTKGRGKVQLPPATPAERVLWSDRYLWDNPFDGYNKTVHRKQCPGNVSWGYWPDIENRFSDFAQPLTLDRIRQLLKEINAPLDDIDHLSANDHAIRLHEVLASQYDLQRDLSSGEPRRVPIKSRADDLAAIEGLEERVRGLEEELLDVKKCKAPPLPRGWLLQVRDKVTGLKDHITELRGMVRECLCDRSLFTGLQKDILDVVLRLGRQLSSSQDREARIQESGAALRERLHYLQTAVAESLAVTQKILLSCPVPSMLHDDVPVVPDALRATYQRNKEIVVARTGQLSLDLKRHYELPRLGAPFDPRDAHHSKLALHLVRQAQGVGELASALKALQKRYKEAEDEFEAKLLDVVAQDSLLQKGDGDTAQKKLDEVRAEAEKQVSNLASMHDMMASKAVEDGGVMGIISSIETYLGERNEAGNSEEVRMVCERLRELDTAYNQVRSEQLEDVQRLSDRLNRLGETKSLRAAKSVVSMLSHDQERVRRNQEKLDHLRQARAERLSQVMELDDLASAEAKGAPQIRHPAGGAGGASEGGHSTKGDRLAVPEGDRKSGPTSPLVKPRKVNDNKTLRAAVYALRQYTVSEVKAALQQEVRASDVEIDAAFREVMKPLLALPDLSGPGAKMRRGVWAVRALKRSCKAKKPPSQPVSTSTSLGSPKSSPPSAATHSLDLPPMPEKRKEAKRPGIRVATHSMQLGKRTRSPQTMTMEVKPLPTIDFGCALRHLNQAAMRYN